MAEGPPPHKATDGYKVCGVNSAMLERIEKEANPIVLCGFAVLDNKYTERGEDEWQVVIKSNA